MIRHLPLLLLLSADVALADPQPMTGGHHPAPMRPGEVAVAVARETLRIDIRLDVAEVTATLELENRGPATALDVGFPCAPAPGPEVVGLDCKTRLDVRLDGKKARAVLKRRDRTWVWPMKLAQGARQTVVVHYLARLRNDRYKIPFEGLGTFYYRLATGATWAGPIDELDMTVTLPADTIINIEPPGYSRQRGQIHWHLERYEPAGDLVIDFASRESGNYLYALGATSWRALEKARAANAFPAKRIAKLAGELRAETDELMKMLQFLHTVSRARVGLAAPDEKAARACIEESARLLEDEAKLGK